MQPPLHSFGGLLSVHIQGRAEEKVWGSKKGDKTNALVKVVRIKKGENN